VARLAGPLFQSFRQAKAHQQAGRLDEAVRLYRHILATEPHHAESLHALGLIALQARRFDLALEPLRRAVAIDPAPAAYHLTLATALDSTGRPDDAIEQYRAAATRDPKDIAALQHLGVALARRGRLAEAEPCFREISLRRPSQADAHANLGNALLGLGRLDEAETALREAVRLSPRSAGALADLAGALHGLGRLDAAAAAAQDAVRLDAQLPAAHHVLGNIRAAQGRMSDAANHYGEALRLDPAAVTTEHNLGNALSGFGRIEEADRCYRRALQAEPGFALAHSSLLLNLNYLPDRSADLLAAEHRRWDELHGRTIRSARHDNDRSADRPLRVGYVSGDFRQHPVGQFFEPLLDRHDRTQIESFCYAKVGRPDELTSRLQARADHWISISALDEAAAAERIRADRIDLLIDLAGHTNGGQMLLFARRPAPVQISWLGYPHWTGLDAIDYRLSDRIADPPDQGATERIEYLDGGFLCYRPPLDAAAVTPPPARSKGRVTFGSFNNLAKLNDGILARWAAILHAVPDSSLLLKAKPLVELPVQDRYRSIFARLGIGPERLDLRAATLSPVDHLALYGEIDIALDPEPYNGTTTSCEALWMGVPVITLAGTRHASRVGASLLTDLHLTELIAADADAYVGLAAALALDIDRLEELRAGMRARMRASSLMDAERFARSMEAAYRRIWRRHCGEAAQ